MLARDETCLTATGRALQPDEVYVASDGGHRAAGWSGGRDLRLSGRAAGDPLEGASAGLCRVRHAAAGQPRGDRREQAAGRGSGLDQGATGRPTSPVGGSGRATTLEPEVWPDERPRGSLGADRLAQVAPSRPKRERL